MPRKPNKSPINSSLDRPYAAIGDRLKQFRLDKGLNQTDIGSQSTITRFESGVRLPGTEFLIKLREKHGADLNWILCGE